MSIISNIIIAITDIDCCFSSNSNQFLRWSVFPKSKCFWSNVTLQRSHYANHETCNEAIL